MNPLVRNIAEKLLRDKVRLRSMPQEFGGAPIYMSTAMGLRAVVKPVAEVDPTLLAAARQLVKPGDTVWDIGGNVGLFSVASAALAGAQGKVYTFEPDPFLIQLLRRTSGAQPSSSAVIRVIPAAVACGPALREFSIASRARASNALSDYGNHQMGSVAETVTVVTLPPDFLLESLPAPDVVKIDVEGAEVEVLKSAETLLDKVRPAIICEVAPSNNAEVTRLLSQAEYVLFDASLPLKQQVPKDSASWNTIALPRETAGIAG